MTVRAKCDRVHESHMAREARQLSSRRPLPQSDARIICCRREPTSVPAEVDGVESSRVAFQSTSLVTTGQLSKIDNSVTCAQRHGVSAGTESSEHQLLSVCVAGNRAAFFSGVCIPELDSAVLVRRNQGATGTKCDRDDARHIVLQVEAFTV